jgi:hypothetical protein
MKTLITALALSAAAIVPLTAHAGPRAHAHAYAHAGSRPFVHGQRFAAYPHIYWQGQDLGTDPDTNIRVQMRRDADSFTSNH